MDKFNPPRSFGVFKPVDHTIIAYGDVADMEAAIELLQSHGFDEADLTRYTPQEMMAQVDADLAAASPMASVGQELNLVKAHYGLAQQGCSFLVVHAPEKEHAPIIEAIVRDTRARAAQRYGSFVIEELVHETVEGDTQVFESPDRGLDIDVPESHP
ncbi:MAG: hypothetical protein ABI343_02855 [Burkholderiaceae bacterium]